MMRRAAAVLAVILLAARGASADVSDYLGRPVARIGIETNGRPVIDRRMLDLIEIHVGEPLAVAGVKESILHLFSLGLYEDVRARATAVGQGVSLVFELIPLREVAAVAFRGAEAGIDEGRLRRVVGDRFGGLPRPGRAAELVRLLEDDLKQVGYLHPAVSFRVQDDRNRRATLIFDLSPGPRSRIGVLDVRGDAGMPPAQLLAALDLRSGEPFEREALSERIERYLEGRRSRGFLAARLSVLTRSADGDRTVDLTLAVEQGPRVRLEFTGDPLPADRRTELVPVASEGAADEDLLEDSGHRIEDYLRAQGYRDAKATYTRRETPDELVITFTVTRGAQYRVARVDIAGTSAYTPAALSARLRIRPGQPFSESALEGDVERVEDIYRREGYAAVEVNGVVSPQPGTVAEKPVDLRIEVIENERTLVGAVTFAGNTLVPDSDLVERLTLRSGQPYFAADVAADREALQLRYANLGFQSASIASGTSARADGSRMDVVFRIQEGPRTFVDHVLIAGNQRTRTSTIERELQFKPGDPLGLEAINESQRRLVALGLFRRARVTELRHGDETKRDVLITVDEAPVTTIGYGGGIEAAQRSRRTEAANGIATENLEFAPRAFFEVGRRNLFGKNRSINLFTRISLRPEDSPYFANQPASSADDGESYGFSEYRVIGTFREPRALRTGADALLTGTLEQQIRSSFNFSRRAFNAQIGRRLTRRVSVSGSYQIQRTELFDERFNQSNFNQSDRLLVDRLFPQVRLSSFSLSVVRDSRDDAIDPTEGYYTSANLQVAGRRIGSEVGLAKTYLTGQTFRALPGTRVVVAGSARLGMAAGFPRLAVQEDAQGQPLIGPDGQPVLVEVRALPASERFFAGGDTTVRGFALDQLGTAATIDQDGFPIGGGGLLIVNAELRVPVRGGLGLVGFIDAGNVYARATDIGFGDMRSAIGFGVRYKSPIGPIRVDLGFKTERREITAGTLEGRSAVHISLGQAF